MGNCQPEKTNVDRGEAKLANLQTLVFASELTLSQYNTTQLLTPFESKAEQN